MFEKKDEVKAAVKTEGEVAEVATTDKEKAAKKNEASKRMIAKKKAAIKVLSDLAARLGSLEEKTAAAYLSGEGRTPGVARAPAQDFMNILFKNTIGTVIGEGEVFKLTKMGRLEMRAFIKKQVAADRYVSFDAAKEEYKYEGTSKPANWTGPNKPAPKL